MSLKCPYRNQSYSTWQLKVFKSLCSTTTISSVDSSRSLTSATYLTNNQFRRVRYTPKTRAENESINDGHVEGEDQSRKATSSSHVARQSTRRHKKSFDPYSDSGRKELKNLVRDLQNITQDVMQKEGLKIRKSDNAGSHSLPITEKTLPESPVLRKIRKKRKHKRPASTEELERWATNPWAQMIASPLRFCQATGVRSPVSLMTNWGLTRHPTDKRVYLMPNELAGVKAVEMQDTKAGSQKGSSTFDTTENPKNQTQQVPPPAVRLLPYQPLLSHLTLAFQKEQSASRIIPHRWKARFKLAKMYRHNLEEVNAAIGQTTDPTPSVEASLNLSKVQWQADIDIRLLEILRKRVLTALEIMASSCANEVARPEARIMALAVPNDGHLILASDRTSETVTKTEQSNANNVDQNGKSKHNVTRPHDESTSIASGLSGSVLIHIGPIEPDFQTSPTSKVPMFSQDQLIPPMITVNETIRIPVFSIFKLLGPDHYSQFLLLRDRFKMLQAPRNSHPSQEDSTYLVLIKSTNESTMNAIKELWQLWRYMGGKSQIS